MIEKKFRGSKSRKIKILIADDDPYNIEITSIFLKYFNAEIYEATNGQEAVEIVKKNHDIDIILMDINMPEMDGLEACKKIKHAHQGIQIIASTAYASKYEISEVMKGGFDDFLLKPFSRERLITIVKKLIVLNG